jgi:imidazolonepropionase-like amidohydrolase
MSRRKLSAAAAFGALVLAAAGANAQTTAITNARLLTAGPAGEVQNGTVVIRDGKIVAAGAGVAVPAGARVIDASGKIVTPGLIVADSALGLTEVSSVVESVDTQSTSASVTASFDVAYGLNPESVTLPTARTGGITRAIVVPGVGAGRNSGLLFGGQAAVVHTGQSADMLVKPRVAQVVELGQGGAARVGGARGASVVRLKEMLDEVRFFQRNRADYDEGDSRELSLSRADLEALIPVVEGRMPLIVGVSRASDIRNVLKLAREQRLRVILDGAEEGWFVADEIARAGVPVMINPISNLPGDFERLGASLQNGRRLQAAGVTVILKANEGGAHRARELRYNAGNAVSHGMPYEAALAAVTINPARVFGVADRVGSLEPGKDGDVVIWDGDPFEPLSQPVAVFVQGREQSLTTRGRMLAERYKELNGAYPPAYRR